MRRAQRVATQESGSRCAHPEASSQRVLRFRGDHLADEELQDSVINPKEQLVPKHGGDSATQCGGGIPDRRIEERAGEGVVADH